MKMYGTLVCVALLLVAFSGVALADDVSVTGTVSVTKNDDGAVTAIKITADGVAYSVVLDDVGKTLDKMAGKKVVATGTVEKKDDVQWITVKTCKEVEAAKE